jgi:CDP-diacylglycerol--serine O-phosphatidyltransferase
MTKQAKGIVKHIPNFITSLNLFCGTSAIVFAFRGELVIASYLILLAAVFDFLDGMAARVLHAYSEIGKQLDSLADVVSFGVAPAVIVYNLLLFSGKIFTIPYIPNNPNILLFVFLIPIFSALRLAKFNVDTRQTSSFIGLPTPANAIFWVSFPLILNSLNIESWEYQFFSNPYLISILIVVMSYLLVAEIPMFSLKFKNYKFSENITKYIFLLIAIFFIVTLKTIAIPFVILIYIGISVIENLIKKN